MRTTWKIISGVLAFVLCIGALAGLIGWIGISATQKMVAPRTLEKIMEKADMDAILTALLSTNGENVLTELVTTEPVKKLAVQYISGFAGYVLTGEGAFTLSDEQKEQVADVALEAMAGEVGESSSNVKAVLKMQAQVRTDALLMQIPSYSQLDIGLDNEDLAAIRVVFSNGTKYLLFGMMVLCLALIMLVRFSWHEGLIWGGITGLVAGICLLLAKAILSTGMQNVSSGNPMSDSMAQALLGEAGNVLMVDGLWVTGVSCLMMAVFFIVRARRKAKGGAVPARHSA